MGVKVRIVFYSLYGHVYQLAEAVAEGAREAGAEVVLERVPELLSPEILEKMGATEARKAFAHVPEANPRDLADADAIILGTPTRFGAATASMQAYLDATGGLWASRALVGKAGSAFASTATQHGGQETTIVHLHTFFYHHGMVAVGVPYSAPGLSVVDEVTGGSPYGASTVAGPRGERAVTPNELEVARFQGRHVASIAAKLARD